MHVLFVVAHHDPHSLTHGIARKIAEGLVHANPTDTFEIADLAAEGFDPRYTFADHAVHHGEAAPPADVLAEQARIERADTLVLVYPIYWWSMPALLKGWIDRVFSNGWAFEFSLDTPLVKRLGGLKVHLVAVGGADQGTFFRHGYDTAMTIQIDHGIFDYCGARVMTSLRLLDSETQDPAVHLASAFDLGRQLFLKTNEPVPQPAASTECA